MNRTLNCTQKQLVEDSMYLVPQMVYAMTKTCTYVTEEEQQELCQIGYLALCRAAAQFQEGRPFLPYAKTCIRHAIFDYWRRSARDREKLCSLDASLPEDCECCYEQFLPDTKSIHPETAAARSFVQEYLTELGNSQCLTVQKGIASLCLQQQGYNSFELAEHFQVPANRVRAWQSKARKLLQQDATLYALLT